MPYRKNGFTLIELLVVISIISLLSSIILATLSSVRGRAQIAAGQTFADQTYHTFGADSAATFDFDEGSGNTAYDTSGNGNNGTLMPGGVSGPLWTTDSIQGTALVFNGTSNYVSLGNNNTSLSSISDVFTIGAWIKLSTINNRMVIYTNGDINYGGDPTNSFTFDVSYGCGSLSEINGLEIILPGIYVGCTASNLLSANTWYYVAYTKNGPLERGIFYIDGVAYPPIDYTGVSTSFASGNNHRFIGMRNNSSLYFNGSIDELHIYTDSLTSEQIKNIYFTERTKYLAKN